MAKITVYTPDELEFDFIAVANAVYKKLNQTENLAVELNIVSPSEIQSVNLSERKIDAVTDVLSFPTLEGIKGEIILKKNYPLDTWVDGKSVFMGSIIICEERAKEQAQEFGHGLNRELCYLFCHGLLHLFGYDHMEEVEEREMRAIATEIMNELNIER